MRRFLYIFIPAIIILALVIVFFPNRRSDAEQGNSYMPVTQSITPSQNGMALTAVGGQQFAPTQAPRPFSHLLVRRDAEVPIGATLNLAVRASVDGQHWSDWSEMTINDDLASPDDGPNVVWSQVFDVGTIANYWQVRAEAIPAASGQLPTIHKLDISTVNTSVAPTAPGTPGSKAGPNTESIVPGSSSSGDQGTSGVGITKPIVVSRAEWGSPDGEGSRAAPQHYPVSHIVVHHTADSSSLYPGEINWAARVRAIWSYHAITRGWGDIGYNYIIDPNGVIYEGRAGGDDAVGFHDTANYGSMGVSMLGTYSSNPPTQATQDSLVKLMAWKSTQRGIDPLGSSFYYGCTISNYCKPYNDGGIVPNIAGHRQVTPGHTTCPGDATMALMPSIRERVRQLIAEGTPPAAQVELVGVTIPQTTIAAGETLEVQLTVKNTGSQTVQSQAPDSQPGYTYLQNECFNGNPTNSLPAFPKESGAVRVVLGMPNWDSANQGSCNGSTSNYPWRWGLNGSLAAGEQRTITGYVQFTTAGSYTIQAGLVQEYVGYLAQAVHPTTITVTPVNQIPVLSSYDPELQPLAQVYSISSVSASLLAGLNNPSSLPRNQLIGSFAWSGVAQDWGAGGPLGQNDHFMVTQVRSFSAVQAGQYTFRLTSDDGSWLFIDGQLLVNNAGLHPTQSATALIQLNAGVHTIAVLAFEDTGNAYLGYDYQAPGANGFSLVPDALASQPHNGAIFTGTPNILLTADNFGSAAISKIRWNLNGGDWLETNGAILQPAKLQQGSYTLQYQAIDTQGHQSAIQELHFGIGAAAPSTSIKLYFPFARH